MQILRSISDMRRAAGALARPVGFVPTMGALHAGHLRLLEAARAECASMVGSLFLNPLQFGEHEDLASYPRDLEGDAGKFAAAGIDVLFAPSVDEMYPPGFSTTIDVGKMGTVYEGRVRPDHFRGVATVVTKLLAIVQPDVLYLGQKDAQQTAVLRKVIRDLALPVEVRIVPTVREADGLAMSSRNVYLRAEERAAAPNLYQALERVREAMQSGASKGESTAAAIKNFTAACDLNDSLVPLQSGNAGATDHRERNVGGTPPSERDNSFSLEYLDVVDADTFEPIETLRAPAFIIGAARFGTTRLIDNLWIAA